MVLYVNDLDDVWMKFLLKLFFNQSYLSPAGYISLNTVYNFYLNRRGTLWSLYNGGTLVTTFSSTGVFTIIPPGLVANRPVTTLGARYASGTCTTCYTNNWPGQIHYFYMQWSNAAGGMYFSNRKNSFYF